MLGETLGMPYPSPEFWFFVFPRGGAGNAIDSVQLLRSWGWVRWSIAELGLRSSGRLVWIIGGGGWAVLSVVVDILIGRVGVVRLEGGLMGSWVGGVGV